MKTLYILRHGKSSWANQNVDDFDRVLLTEGIKRTQSIASFLSSNLAKIDLIISSPAKRALQTAKIISSNLGCKLTENSNLYPSHSSRIANIIGSQHSSIQNLMIVGHNPGLTEFVSEYFDSTIDWLPTSGLAQASFKIENWNEISLNTISISSLLFTSPKTLL